MNAYSRLTPLDRVLLIQERRDAVLSLLVLFLRGKGYPNVGAYTAFEETVDDAVVEEIIQRITDMRHEDLPDSLLKLAATP